MVCPCIARVCMCVCVRACGREEVQLLVKSLLLYMIVGFRREVAENCPFLCYDAMVSGTYYYPQFFTFVLKRYEEVEFIYKGNNTKTSVTGR